MILTIWPVRFKVICDNGSVVLIDAEPVWCSHNYHPDGFTCAGLARSINLLPHIWVLSLWCTAESCPTVEAVAIDFDEHSGQPRIRWKSTQWPQPEVFQFDFTDLSGFLERNQDPVNADRAQDDGGTWLLIKNIQFLHNSHRYFSQRSEWLSTIFLLTEDRWSRNLHVSCLSRSSGCI